MNYKRVQKNWKNNWWKEISILKEINFRMEILSCKMMVWSGKLICWLRRRWRRSRRWKRRPQSPVNPTHPPKRANQWFQGECRYRSGINYQKVRIPTPRSNSAILEDDDAPGWVWVFLLSIYRRILSNWWSGGQYRTGARAATTVSRRNTDWIDYKPRSQTHR